MDLDELKNISTEVILTRMVSRLGEAMGYRKIKLPQKTDGIPINVETKCIAIITQNLDATTKDIVEFSGCTEKYARDMKRKLNGKKARTK